MPATSPTRADVGGARKDADMTSTAREDLIQIIDDCIPDDLPGYRQRYTDKAVDAIHAAGYRKQPDPGQEARDEIAQIVKAISTKWGGPALREFENDPPIRKHFAIADAILAWMEENGYRKQPEPRETAWERVDRLEREYHDNSRALEEGMDEIRALVARIKEEQG